MFETITEVPDAIKVFYHTETVSEPTGECTLESYVYTDAEGVEQVGMKSMTEYHEVSYVRLIGFGECQDNLSQALSMFKPQEVVEQHLRFVHNLQRKTFHNDYLKWYNTCIEDCWETWEEDEPTIPEPVKLDDRPEYTKWRKMVGIEFEGIMCSATGDDFKGLGVALDWLRVDGNETRWEFDNGNFLVLGPHNVEEFYNVWFPFRMGFFIN